MQKKKADELIGKTLNHKKYGAILIQEFTNLKEDKFIGVIVETNEVKRLVLSRQFFDVPETFGLPHHKELDVVRKPQIKKEHDYAKYRNHPLVKQIDKLEANKYDKMYTTQIDEDEEDEVDEFED